MRSMASLQEISLREIKGIQIGHATDAKGGTGVTVILAPKGAMGSVTVAGGAPATRELALLSERNMIQSIQAVVLSGGSAFGLDAAGGVMRYLVEQDCGFETGYGKVPIVCGASLFDLCVADAKAHPDGEMGYAACLDAESGAHMEDCGNIGAGTGATIGKILGPTCMMKGGLGCYAVRCGQLEVAAIYAVNALGSIYSASGQLLAGPLNEDKTQVLDSGDLMLQAAATQLEKPFSANTTIGCIITNALLTKAEAGKVTAVAHDGLAHSIFPVHTQADGDTVFCLATGGQAAPVDLVSAIAAEISGRAIERAVLAAESAYGLSAAKDL